LLDLHPLPNLASHRAPFAPSGAAVHTSFTSHLAPLYPPYAPILPALRARDPPVHATFSPGRRQRGDTRLSFSGRG
jgi:hypothetical protein